MKFKLYALSVLLSVIGLGIMYASSIYVEPPEVKVGSIDASWNGKPVKIKGTVRGHTNVSNNIFIDLKDPTGEITVLSFDSKTRLSKGDRIQVQGNVELYRGKVEVIANNITRI
ncbi:MAG: OB-fold nucleic acid binding domain-containing protein [Nanohaloarchaea archaeon]|nr:OB-fold nucleic acid binding domain-containing protein [Candidatus Nanohaloarchaea archaeon]